MEALGDMVAAHGIAMVLGLLVLRIGVLVLERTSSLQAGFLQAEGLQVI